MDHGVGSVGLRLAGALAHTVPGAALRMSDVDGGRWLVAHHRPDATINPCTMRAALLGRVTSCAPPLAEIITDATFVGGLDDLGGGLYRMTGEGAEERWLGTTLGPSQTQRTLAEATAGSGPNTAGVHATVHPDLALGVTLVRLGADHPAAAAHLDHLGARLLAACMVAELLVSARQEASGR
jgi:hypothetical protein